MASWTQHSAGLQQDTIQQDLKQYCVLMLQPFVNEQSEPNEQYSKVQKQPPALCTIYQVMTSTITRAKQICTLHANWLIIQVGVDVLTPILFVSDSHVKNRFAHLENINYNT